MAAVLDREGGLDRDRTASMADEGGAAAARVEAQTAVARPSAPVSRGRGWVGLVVIAAVALASLALVLRRSEPRPPGAGGVAGRRSV